VATHLEAINGRASGWTFPGGRIAHSGYPRERLLSTMMRAMFAAIAGLRNHITYMDVVGNNIANVNTTAFKSSRVTFQDMMSQTQTGASAPTANRGGTNPIQVGLGMTLGGIDVLQAQGSLQSTGKLTDFAIQG